MKFKDFIEINGIENVSGVDQASALDEALLSPFDAKESTEMIAKNSTRKSGQAPLDSNGEEIDGVILDQGGQALVYVDFSGGAYRITNLARNGSHRILFTKDGAKALKKYIS